MSENNENKNKTEELIEIVCLFVVFFQFELIEKNIILKMFLVAK